jgi:hypothetical protein
MATSAAKSLSKAIGQSPEALTLEERLALAGKMIAMEIYSPETTPLRRIEAIGDSAAECIAQLVSRGLDPANFEFSRLHPPY